MTDGEIEDLRLNFKEFLSGDIWTLAVDDLLEMNCICESQTCLFNLATKERRSFNEIFQNETCFPTTNLT